MNRRSQKSFSGRLKRGAVLGAICAVVTFLILMLLQDNLAVGTTIAALTAILLYFILGRFL